LSPRCHIPNDDLSPDLAGRERRGLFWNIFAVLSGHAGTLIFGVLVMALTTRLLGAGGYGRLALFFLALNLLSDVLVNWPNAAVIRFGREEMAEERGMARTFWARLLLLALALGVSAALVLVLRERVGRYVGLGMGAAWLLLGYLALSCLVEALGYVLQAQGRFRWYAWLAPALKALNFVLIGAFIALGPLAREPRNVLGVHLISLALVLGVACAGTAWRRVVPVRLDRARLGQMLRYSWPLVFVSASGFIVAWVDVAVINLYWDKARVGVYSVSYQCVHVFGGVRVAILVVLAPLIMSLKVRREFGALAGMLDRVFPQGVWALGFLLALAGVAAEAIPFVCGESFTGAVLPFQVLAAAMAFDMIAAFCQGVARAFDRTRQLAYIGVTLCALNLAADLWLVPRLGPVGAALGTAFAMMVANAMYVPLMNRIGEVRGASSPGRYAALLGAIPCLAVAAVSAVVPSVGWRVGLCLAALVVIALVVRAAGLFRKATLHDLDGVAMPRTVRWCAEQFYEVMGE